MIPNYRITGRKQHTTHKDKDSTAVNYKRLNAHQHSPSLKCNAAVSAHSPFKFSESETRYWSGGSNLSPEDSTECTSQPGNRTSLPSLGCSAKVRWNGGFGGETGLTKSRTGCLPRGSYISSLPAPRGTRM